MRLQQDVGWSCGYLRAQLGLDDLHNFTENLNFFVGCWQARKVLVSPHEPLLEAL